MCVDTFTSSQEWFNHKHTSSRERERDQKAVLKRQQCVYLTPFRKAFLGVCFSRIYLHGSIIIPLKMRPPKCHNTYFSDQFGLFRSHQQKTYGINMYGHTNFGFSFARFDLNFACKHYRSCSFKAEFLLQLNVCWKINNLIDHD